MNSSLLSIGLITSFQMMLMNAMRCGVGIMPIMGWIADKVRYEKLMFFSCISLTLLSYLFFLVYSFNCSISSSYTRSQWGLCRTFKCLYESTFSSKILYGYLFWVLPWIGTGWIDSIPSHL